MIAIASDWPGLPANVRALTSLRGGGVSRPPYDDGIGGGGLNLGLHVGDRAEDVLQNRSLLQSLLPAGPCWLTQVHGVQVIDAAAHKDFPDKSSSASQPEADAAISSKAGCVCVIQTADCLPVLLSDSRGHVVGAAHAGWRGLSAGVIENTIAAMRRRGAQDIMAWLGPAIGPEQFEVGEDVRNAFIAKNPGMSSAFKPRPQQHGKYLADIYALARMVMAENGIAHIAGGGFCTVTETGRFYSYRRDGVTGRMASLIWIAE